MTVNAVFRPFDDRLAGLQQALAGATNPADVAALGVLRGLMTRGIAVPDQIALIGYDDMAFAQLSAVPLTSIRQPAAELGATAARLLIEECSGAPHKSDPAVEVNKAAAWSLAWL